MTSSPDGNDASRVSDRARVFAYRGDVAIAIRRLVSGEEAVAEAYLATVPERTLFLRSNLARAGLVGDGRPFSGVYAGAFHDGGDGGGGSGGALVGVAAHFWNDNIVVAPGPHAEALALHAVALTGKRVGGILGPHVEVTRVRSALGLDAANARFASKEILYALALEELVVPPALSNGDVVVRTPSNDEHAALLEWRMQYCAETSSTPDTPEARADQRRYLAAYQDQGHHFVLTDARVTAQHDQAGAGGLVAYSAFNATIADTVQIGGVWTPPELRGRGHARCVVAGSLQHARDRGVRSAILFTDEKNVAAQRSYVAVGFRPIGDYGIVFFAD
jgi:RimJ/RimL family protein N-acetyltransferase